MITVVHKAVIVGCGNIAGGYDEKSRDKESAFSHAGAYRKAGVDIIAASDVNEKRLREFSEFWEVQKTYNNYKDMIIAEKADIVSVCVPDEFHEEVVLFAASNSSARIIFCEKPLAPDSESARRMIEACRANNKMMVVDYQRRWEPTHIEAKRMIENGEVGKIQGITGYYVKGLLHNGSHFTNTLRFLVGEEPKKSFLLGNDLVMDFGGFHAFLMSSDKGGYEHSAFEIDIMGSLGRLRFSENGNLFEFFQAEDYREYPRAGFKMLYLKESKKTRMGSALPEGIKEIIGILDGKKYVSVNSAENALRDIEIIEEATKNKTV